MIRSAISPRLAISTTADRGHFSSCEATAAAGRTRPVRRWRRRICTISPSHARAHGVHQLHHLDDADDAVGSHTISCLHEGRFAGFGRAIEDAQQRRGNGCGASRARSHWRRRSRRRRRPVRPPRSDRRAGSRCFILRSARTTALQPQLHAVDFQIQGVEAGCLQRLAGSRPHPAHVRLTALPPNTLIK